MQKGGRERKAEAHCTDGSAITSMRLGMTHSNMHEREEERSQLYSELDLEFVLCLKAWTGKVPVYYLDTEFSNQNMLINLTALTAEPQITGIFMLIHSF